MKIAKRDLRHDITPLKGINFNETSYKKSWFVLFKDIRGAGA